MYITLVRLSANICEWQNLYVTKENLYVSFLKNYLLILYTDLKDNYLMKITSHINVSLFWFRVYLLVESKVVLTTTDFDSTLSRKALEALASSSSWPLCLTLDSFSVLYRSHHVVCRRRLNLVVDFWTRWEIEGWSEFCSMLVRVCCYISLKFKNRNF